MSEEFKTIAAEFADISKQITDTNRQVKELKMQKDQMAAAILAYLKTNSIDEVCLPEGATIVRKISKRSGTLKKEMIFDEFKAQLGDEAKAEHAVQNLYSRREVLEKEMVSLMFPRGSRAQQTLDDDDE